MTPDEFDQLIKLDCYQRASSIISKSMWIMVRLNIVLHDPNYASLDYIMPGNVFNVLKRISKVLNDKIC